MRIAFFLGAFPAISETFILRQITGLSDLGHEVDIYAQHAPDAGDPVHPEVVRRGLLARTRYVSLPLAIQMELPIWPITGITWSPDTGEPVRNARRLFNALPVVARAFRASPLAAWSGLQRSEFGYQAASLSPIYRIAAMGRPAARFDVLHAHFGPVADNFRFARRTLHAPLVVSFHGYDFTSWPRAEGVDCYSRLWPAADLVTVNSDYTWDRVRGLGCPEAKLRKLPVGLDLADFQFRVRTRAAGDPVRILTVGRMVEKKGHEYALHALALLRRTHPDFHYTMVGDGPLRPRLESLVRELGLERRVSMPGPCDSSDVAKRMDAADLFLLPAVTSAEGDTEGQCLVLQEAQACGLPVVATQHGPIPEGVLDGRSALLVPERDPQALARALSELVEAPGSWSAMGGCGRAFVAERYDIRRLNLRLVELYREAADLFRPAAVAHA